MSVYDDQVARDTADLERFGYKQELKRELHTFSSFAVAFSYISPSTGIFTLFFLGMAALGAYLFWTWPIVALMQFVVALNFAELSSHFPVAGSVYQWTKYLANRGYAWFTGWFYLIAGILTVASVCATLPLALFPMLNTMFGWNLTADFTTGGHVDQAIAALVTLALITSLNIFGVKLAPSSTTRGCLRSPRDGHLRDLPGGHGGTSGCGRHLRFGQSGNSSMACTADSRGFFLVGMFMSST